MKLERTDKIVCHGFKDWIPSFEEFTQMLNTAQIGASQDCDVTINGVTLIMKEWQELLTANSV